MKKIVIRLMGGLGNQLFQYAFGKQLSLKYHMELLLDKSSYLRKGGRAYELEAYAIGERVLNVVEALYCNVLYYADMKLGVGGKHIVCEDALFQYNNVCVGSNNYYVGFWQNEKYFENIKDDLLEVFISKKGYDDKTYKIIEEVKQSESVAVHVRRGDYLLKEYSNVYVVQDASYYQKAREYMSCKKHNLKFYIFSDDLEWCKQNFEWDNCCFVDDAITDDPIMQFEIMRKCKHYIIANSTYSWWAAWLGENKDSIKIAPDRWYVDDKINIDCKRALLNSFVQI